MPAFNLLDEPWIPCLGNDGKLRRIGVREALTQAGTIRQIAASNPMDRLAILRFLLALLYWCKGNPPADTDIPSDSLFPSDWFAKLDQHRDCFDLLGEGKRFYQCHVAEPCRDENKEHEVIPLIHEIPNGDDKWHFRHSTDKVDGLCLACCALGLVRLPMFTSGEGRGWHQGVNGTPPIYVLPFGRTLLETLCANWVPCGQLGEAAWVKPDIRPIPGQDVPLLTGLTLLPRRVWMHDPVGEMGICIACGSRRSPIIKTCEYQSSGPLKTDLWNDPHVIYLNKKPRKALIAEDLTAAGKFRMDRPWPNLIARMVEPGKFNAMTHPVKILVVGFATDKAKTIDVWERTIEVKVPLQSTPVWAVSKWQKESQGLVFQLNRVLHKAPTKGPSRKQPAEVISALAGIRPHVEATVSSRIGELLTGGDAAWQEAADEYRPMMEMIAKSLSPGFTTAAVLRQRQIASALPDMRPSTGPAKTATGKKTARKEGGTR